MNNKLVNKNIVIKLKIILKPSPLSYIINNYSIINMLYFNKLSHKTNYVEKYHYIIQ